MMGRDGWTDEMRPSRRSLRDLLRMRQSVPAIDKSPHSEERPQAAPRRTPDRHTGGTMGLSYAAHTQAALGCLAPPGLACQFLDSGGFSNAYLSGIRQGGAFELKQATWAIRQAREAPEVLADPAAKAALDAVDAAAWFTRMPWRRGVSPLAAAPDYEAYL